MTDSIRVEVRVKPRSRLTSVGGTSGPTGALAVSVTAPAADGRANAAVLKVLASILHVRRRQLHIVSGVHHRTKVIQMDDPPPGTHGRLEQWRAGPAVTR